MAVLQRRRGRRAQHTCTILVTTAEAARARSGRSSHPWSVAVVGGQVCTDPALPCFRIEMAGTPAGTPLTFLPQIPLHCVLALCCAILCIPRSTTLVFAPSQIPELTYKSTKLSRNPNPPPTKMPPQNLDLLRC